ncbi:MAG: TlpA disulfide reductase family protein [Bacteroidota bacterium]
MIKNLLSASLLLLSAGAFAQSKTATLSGTLVKFAGDSLTLDAGDHKPIKIAVDKKGSFKSTFKIDSGAYYAFNTGVLYLAPGMALDISKPDTVLVYAGKGSVENNIFKQINGSINKYVPFGQAELFEKMVDTAPAEFLKEMDDYKVASNKLLTDNKGLSKYFVKTQQQNIDYIIRWATDTYKTRYGKDPLIEKEQRQLIRTMTSAEALKANRDKLMALLGKMYAKRMEPQDHLMINKLAWVDFDVNNVDLFKLSAPYKLMLNSRIATMVSAEKQKTAYTSNKSTDEMTFDVTLKELNNSYIKQALTYPNMRLLLRPGRDSVDAIYNKFMAMATDQFYKTKVEALYKSIKLYGKGGQTPLFVFNDVNDKPIALKDLLKGNYVYIDIWATWCGPCIAEIPSLKKMEEKYHDKPIKFVSISIDATKDKEKWKSFVKDKQLGGVQVYAGQNSDFVTKYNVPFIPRFILLDPNGKIVSEDAERPSNPKLQEQLDQLLK